MMAGRNRLQLTLRLEADNKTCNFQKQSKMDGANPSPPGTIQPAGNVGASCPNPRKRTNDEVYPSSQTAHSSPPRSPETSKRLSTAPEQNVLQQMVAQSSFEQTGFGALPSNHASTSVSTRSTMKPESTSASTNSTVEGARTFQDAMIEFRDQLDEEYSGFKQKLNERDRDAELDEFDWDELEARYHTAIDPKVEAEQETMNECFHLFEVIQQSA
jgi:hypothetical protein